MATVNLTEADLEVGRQMLADGATWKAIAERFGVSSTTAHRLFDEEYDERRGQKCREAEIEKRSFYKGLMAKPGTFTATKRDAERLFRMVPEDTRNFTQRAMGDPLPGRSALDRMERSQ